MSIINFEGIQNNNKPLRSVNDLDTVNTLPKLMPFADYLMLSHYSPSFIHAITHFYVSKNVY